MYDFSIRARDILLFVSYLWPKSEIHLFIATSSLLPVNVIVTAFTLIEAGRCFLASLRMRENHWYCSIYSSLFKQKLLVFCELSIIETRHTIHQVVHHWTTVAFVSLTLLCLSAVNYFNLNFAYIEVLLIFAYPEILENYKFSIYGVARTYESITATKQTTQ